MVVIKDILNKGKGVFASSFIKRNSLRIMSSSYFERCVALNFKTKFF